MPSVTFVDHKIQILNRYPSKNMVNTYTHSPQNFFGGTTSLSALNTVGYEGAVNAERPLCKEGRKGPTTEPSKCLWSESNCQCFIDKHPKRVLVEIDPATCVRMWTAIYLSEEKHVIMVHSLTPYLLEGARGILSSKTTQVHFLMHKYFQNLPRSVSWSVLP